MQCYGNTSISGALSYQLTQACDVVRQVFNVYFTQRLSYAGHVSRIIGAPASFEIQHLFNDVIVLLPRDTWNLILARKSAQMTHRAEGLVGLGHTQLNLGFVSLERGWLAGLRGIEVAQVNHVLTT